ncbi:MAG: Zn-dependent alcohol dehydrogenase [Alphaproteobacteria bacterium]
MKAAVCRAFGEPLTIEDIEIADPQLNELKIKISAVAICHSDIHYAEGAWGGPLPAVYGHEAAGIVEKVGPGVKDLQQGDFVVITLIRACGHCYHCARGNRTICEHEFSRDGSGALSTPDGAPVEQSMKTGAFAEYVLVDRSQVAKIPSDIPRESASLLGCGVITGLGAVTNTAKIPARCSVAVIGTGGVGLNSIQGARLAGARTIVAMDLVESKRKTALDFGATHAVDPSANDAKEQVLAATDGRGADYVFVTVGATRAYQQSISFLAPGGSVVYVGMPAVGETIDIEPLNIAGYGQSIRGSLMGSTHVQQDIPALADLYRQGRLKLDELVSNTYPLDRINEAIAEVKKGEVLRNVIVFD